MTDSLTIFGTDFTGVTGIKATGTGNGTLTYIRPQGTKSITSNGTNIDVTEYAAVDVSVSGGTPRTSTDLIVSGATVTAPAGVYASDASASVASGSVTAPSTISGTGASVSASSNTLTLSKTVSVTPNVTTAGYVTAGTAGNASVSLSANVTTQAAQTIYPSTSDQSIAASRYLTGAQTIKGVAVANLTAANVKQGVTVTIGDSADADRIMSVTGTYSGGSSKNVQVAQSTSRATSSTYTKIASLTCSTAGKYDVYWDCFRSSTSGTSGSQLYIGGDSYGTANTTFSNQIHVQTNHLSNVSISKDDEVAVYARSRGSNYYAYCGQLTIVQTA